MKKAKKILTLVACAVLLVCISVGATLAYLTSQTEIVENTFTVGHVKITLDEAAVEKVTDNKAENYGDYVEDEDADPARVQENEYDLHPGITALKDPTIHVEDGSENCYLVAKIVVTADNMTDATHEEPVKTEDGSDTTVTVTDTLGLRTVLGYEGSEGLIGFGGIVTGGVLSEVGAEDIEDNKTAAGATVWQNDEYILTQQTVDTDDKKTNVFYVYFKNVIVKNDATNNSTVDEDDDDQVIFNKIKIPEGWNNDEMAALAGLNIKVEAFAVQEDGFANVVDAFEAAFKSEYEVAAPEYKNN